MNADKKGELLFSGVVGKGSHDENTMTPGGQSFSQPLKVSWTVSIWRTPSWSPGEVSNQLTNYTKCLISTFRKVLSTRFTAFFNIRAFCGLEA
jgi:hypothetical protein